MPFSHVADAAQDLRNFHSEKPDGADWNDVWSVHRTRWNRLSRENDTAGQRSRNGRVPTRAASGLQTQGTGDVCTSSDAQAAIRVECFQETNGGGVQTGRSTAIGSSTKQMDRLDQARGTARYRECEYRANT